MSGPRHAGWIGIMLLLGTLAGCSQSPQAAREEAARLAAAGDLKGAVLQLKSAAQRLPNDAALRAALGDLYNASFDAVAAVKELGRARELGLADDPAVALSLAQALRRQGKFSELLKTVPVEDGWPAPQRGEVRALRGRAQHALGDPAAAAATLERAQTEAPSGQEVALLAAQIKAGKRDFSGALADVDDLLKRAPGHYDALVYRAVLLRAAAQVPAAIAAWGEVLKQNPRDFTGLLLRSRLLLGQDEVTAAAADAARLRKEYPGQPAALVQHGVIALVEGKPRVSLDDAQAALQVAPTLFSAMLLAGLSHHALGAESQAAEMLKACLAAQPAHGIARRAYVETLLKLNQPAIALQVAAAGGDSDPRLLSLAAEAHFALNEPAAAEALLARAASLGPPDAGLQIRRALATLGAGEEGQGLTELASAVQLAEGATPADELLVVRLLRGGDLAGAARAIEALAKRAPDSALTHNLRGLLAVQQGDAAAAVKAFTAALTRAPAFLPAAVNLAHLQLAQGDVAAARASYRAVAAAAPDALAPLLALADFERVQGERQAAREAYTAALAISAKSLPAHLGLIALALAGQDKPAAEQAAEAALQQLPDERLLLLPAARALHWAGQPRRIDELIRHYLALDAASPMRWLEAAAFYRSIADDAAADRSLRDGLAAAPGYAPLQVAWVTSLLARDRLPAARTFVVDLQARQPGAPVGWLLAGALETKAGRHREAAAAYAHALTLQPVGQIAWQWFAASARAGQAAAAEASLLAFAEAHAGDVFVHSRLGDLALGRGDYPTAITRYERALAAGPATAEVLNNLAWACWRQGDLRARQFAEAAWRAAPDSPLTLDTLGWILLAEKDSTRAIELLRQAALRAPTDPDIRYHHAAALAATGQTAAAREALALALAGDEPFVSRQDAERLRARLK